MINNLIMELKEKGIQLTYNNGNIRYYGPEDQITSDILVKIKENKESLISYLRSHEVETTSSSDNQFGETSDHNENLYNFEQLISYLNNNAYKFAIKNAKLCYNSPNEDNNPEVANAISKYYNHLFKLNWPNGAINLTPIQPEGQTEPFFLVHGDQCTPILHDTFGEEIPLFDFFHQSHDGSRMKYNKVEEIAKFYLTQLLNIKDSGNFLLGGYSFGGLIAYEMAQQLIKMGKTVKLLILIDTHVPGFDGYIYDKSKVYRVFKCHIFDPLRYGLVENLKYGFCNVQLMLGKPIPSKFRNLYILHKYAKTYKSYKLQKSALKFCLITAKRKYQLQDPYLGWRKFINNKIELTSLPATHKELVKNPAIAKLLSEKIRSFVKEVY